MIRALVVIAGLALLAFGLGWLADRPGAVDLVWQGWHVKTSLTTAVVALLALALVLTIVIGAIRAVLRIPESMSLFFRITIGPGRPAMRASTNGAMPDAPGLVNAYQGRFGAVPVMNGSLIAVNVPLTTFAALVASSGTSMLFWMVATVSSRPRW